MAEGVSANLLSHPVFRCLMSVRFLIFLSILLLVCVSCHLKWTHLIASFVMGWMWGLEGWNCRTGTHMSQLTDARARTIRPGEKPISVGGVSGLYFFPGSVRGQGKWIFRFVSPLTGKRRDMGLGTYPEVGIAAARKAALQARELMTARQDPIVAREAERAAQHLLSKTPTFEAAARQVHDDIKAGFANRKHAAQWLKTLEDYIFPGIGSRLVSDLKAADFAEALRPIWLAKPETASRVRQRCDSVMNWCAANDFVVASPMAVVVRLLPRQPGKRERVAHQPAVPWREVPAFVERVLRTDPGTDGKQMLELLILTATRSGEVRGMRWDEIDLGARLWTIPATRMKVKMPHRVPLAPRTIELLEGRLLARDGGPLVFASRRGTAFSDMILTKLLRDARVPSDTTGRTATAHGFRSAFRDWASESGYPRDLAERALAHTIRNATEAAYHRTDLLEARRGMMEAWDRHVCGGRGP